MALLAFLQLFAVCALLLGAALALGVSISLPRLAPALRRVAPERRARLLLALIAAPVAVGVLQTVVCSIPGVLALAGHPLDHCLEHTDLAHAHLCVAHLPTSAAPVLGWMLIAAVSAVLGVALLRQVDLLLLSRRVVRALVASGEPRYDLDATVVPTDRPFAATDLAGRIIVSDGLLAGLDPGSLEIVMRHERAHVHRRDPMRMLVARFLSVTHLPATRRLLLDELDLACEQACDEQAARGPGGRLGVAETLLAVERLLADMRPLRPAAVGFVGEHLVVRVEALLAPAGPAPRALTERRWLLGLGLASIALADPLHHALEHVAGLLGV